MSLSIKKEHIGYVLLTLVSFIMLVMLFKSSPIAQSQTYHDFSDSVTYFKISNFWNVISNLPFTIIGLVGLFKLNQMPKVKIQYVFFFLGIILISIGSSYYHLSPNDTTLIWDRLPMTIVFMALFSIIISEFINNKVGVFLLYPLLILGVVSILTWIYLNDLRLYALVQFLPIVAIPIILLFFKSRYNLTIGYWILLIAYALAKVLEYYDGPVYSALQVVSGHSLKHIFSAVGLFALLYSYTKRKRLTNNILLKQTIS
jgi:hypothetical protein